MSPEIQRRLLDRNAHDDGVNVWSMTRVAPQAALQGEIASYCDYSEQTRGFTARRELPHPEGVLIFNRREEITITGGDGRRITLRAGEAFIAGVHLRPALSHSCGSQTGVQVDLPAATLRRLVNLPLNELVDQVVPLTGLLGAEAHRLAERLCDAPDLVARVALLDRSIARRLARVAPLDRRVTGALHLLRCRPTLDIAEVAAEVGWSRKHLAARLHDAVGVGPRTFRRLLRFQKLTRALCGGTVRDWARAALDAGYCDQPHMIREFREFAGLKPSEYAARLLAHGGGLVEH